MTAPSITEQSYNLLAKIHAECFAHRDPEPEDRPLPQKGIAKARGTWREPKRSRQAKPEPQRGEVTLKAFILGEAARLGLTYNAIWYRIQRDGKYPNLIIRRCTRNTVFVKQA